MKVFYHNDMDGKLSAFLIGHFTRKYDPDKPIEFIETNYDRTFPLDGMCSDEKVWIVDFSIEPDVMTSLLSITSNVIWIDHHATSIKKYEQFPDFDKEVRAISRYR